MKIADYLPPISGGLRKDKVFYGTVTPSDWNQNEIPVEFSLFTTDEQDILLESPRLKKKFLKLLNKPVEVLGTMSINQYGEKCIFVRKIRRLNFPEFQLLASREPKDYIFDLNEYAPAVGMRVLENLEVSASA